jgi:hypothetical protein
MAAKRSRPAWRRHELVSKAIFEALLKQSNAENLEVKHNVCIKGLKTCHQIDVFWQFRMGGLDHTVIVQVKKKKKPVTKGEMLLFHSVLLDIPGQPKGLFVSEHGYQKGALEVANAAGIPAFVIREVNQEESGRHITITNISIVTLTQKPDQVAIEWVILSPTITNFLMKIDEAWQAQHPEAWPRPADERITAIVSQARLLDADANERTSVQKLVQDHIREFGQVGQTQVEVEFPDPTYVSGIIEGENIDGNPIGDIKMLKLSITL